MGTFITAIVLVVIVSLSVRSMVKAKKAGKSMCGCDCKNCSGHCK